MPLLVLWQSGGRRSAVDCNWGFAKTTGNQLPLAAARVVWHGLKKGGKRANDSSVAAVHDVPGTPGKHLRAMLQSKSVHSDCWDFAIPLLKRGDFWLPICCWWTFESVVTLGRYERKNSYYEAKLYDAATCAGLASLTSKEQAVRSRPEEVHVGLLMLNASLQKLLLDETEQLLKSSRLSLTSTDHFIFWEDIPLCTTVGHRKQRTFIAKAQHMLFCRNVRFVVIYSVFWGKIPSLWL